MNINSFNMTKNSELYITNILDNLDGKEDEKQVENNSSSAKIDTNEEIKLGLTNYQASNDKSNNHSEITNELNKALIRTHGITKSNIDSDDNEEDKEKSDNKSDYKSLPKKSNKNNNLINIINTKELDKKSAIDDLLKPEPKKESNKNYLIKQKEERKKEQIKKRIKLLKNYKERDSNPIIGMYDPNYEAIQRRSPCAIICDPGVHLKNSWMINNPFRNTFEEFKKKQNKLKEKLHNENSQTLTENNDNKTTSSNINTSTKEFPK